MPKPQPRPASVTPINKDSIAALAPVHPGNVEIAFDRVRSRLVVFIDCTAQALAAAAPSASAKSRVLATTTGFAPIPLAAVPGLKLSLTATLPIDGEAAE